MSGNIYFWGAKPSDKEKNIIGSSGFNPGIKLVETGENAVAGAFVDLGKGNIVLKVWLTDPVSGIKEQISNIKNIGNNI